MKRSRSRADTVLDVALSNIVCVCFTNVQTASYVYTLFSFPYGFRFSIIDWSFIIGFFLLPCFDRKILLIALLM